MSTSESRLRESLQECTSAEAFLDHFGVDYEPAVVQVNRLHILKRFHDYLDAHPLPQGADAESHYRDWLVRAYEDFVDSSAQEQKALKIFQSREPGFVPVEDLG